MAFMGLILDLLRRNNVIILSYNTFITEED